MGATVKSAGLTAGTAAPVAVLATVGAMLTVYWVLGANDPDAGVILRVVGSVHWKLTWVAGVIWTAAWVEVGSMGWLNLTSIGCTAATGWMGSTL